MVFPLELPIITPVGTGMEFFDEDDPILLPHPLVIHGSLAEAGKIWEKYCLYRIWHKLGENKSYSSTTPTNPGCQIDEAIRAIYRQNEDDPDFFAGIESVTLIYPKGAHPWVTQQLAHWPQRLPSGLPNTSAKVASKSIHVQGRNGTKSLEVLEECLDINVPGNVVHIYLNNPDSPSWAVAVPRDRSPMTGVARPLVLNEQEVSEQAAWERVKSWLGELGFSADGLPYPNGKNSFPDFRAWIDGKEHEVEMTSVPDLGKWTIKSTYRELETFISEVAKQPGETKEEVVEDLHRVVAKKRNRVETTSADGSERPCVLVVSNWSPHRLFDPSYWPTEDLKAFAAVILIDRDQIGNIPTR